MIEASSIPLPEADNQLKLKTAPSAAGFATTGGMRRTSLSRPATGHRKSEKPSMNAFVCGSPHAKTTTLRIIHGVQALRISDFELRISELRIVTGSLLLSPCASWFDSSASKA